MGKTVCEEGNDGEPCRDTDCAICGANEPERDFDAELKDEKFK